MAVVKLLLVLELLWFLTAYIKSHTVKQVTGLQAEEFPLSEEEVYGIGIGTRGLAFLVSQPHRDFGVWGRITSCS